MVAGVLNPVDTELVLINPFLDPEVAVVVELFVFVGVGGCRCPISIRVVRRPHASLPLWKVPASLALAVELTTFLGMTETGRTTPLFR